MSEQKPFFADKRILLLDGSKATREMIRQTILEFGAEPTHIMATNQYEKAISYLQSDQPTVVFTDIKIGTQSGLHLIQLAKQYATIPSERMFIVITSNANETAIAEAAEEDMDNYLVKPFSVDTLHQYFRETLEEKTNPSPFMKALDEGKINLQQRNFAAAIESFSMAKELSDSPTLAHFYTGECFQLQKNYSEAIRAYDEGLQINPIHYRCLSGKFEALFALKNHPEAYNLIAPLLENFPLNHKRLGKMIQVAVYTHNFGKILNLYEHYKNLEERSEDLRVIIVAALIVAGKYLIKEEREEEGVEALRNAVVSAHMDFKTITNVCQFLIGKGKSHGAQKILLMSTPDVMDSLEYKELNFQILYQGGESKQAMELGQKLISEKRATVNVFDGVINMLIKSKSLRRAENFIYDAMASHPDDRDRFSPYLELVEDKG